MANTHISTCVSLHGVSIVAMLGLLLPLVTGDSVGLFKLGQQASYLHTSKHTHMHTYNNWLLQDWWLNDRVFSFSVHSLSACVSLRTGKILKWSFSQVKSLGADTTIQALISLHTLRSSSWARTLTSDLLRMLLCEIWMWVDISERVLMFKLFDGRKFTSLYGG